MEGVYTGTVERMQQRRGSSNVSICRLDELGESEIVRWRELQTADPALANPFLSPEFILTYARHRPSTRVAIIENESKIVGFVAFEQHPLHVGKALAFGVADRQAIICDSAFTWNSDQMLQNLGLAVFEFDHLPSNQAELFEPKFLKYEEAPVIDLRDGWDAWIAKKKLTSKSRIKRALEKQRKMARELGPLNFEYDSHSHGDLDQLIEWKSDQYRRFGRSNRFAKSWMVDFVHDLLDVRSDEFSMRLSRLDAGDHTVGLYLSVRGNNTLGSWFPAFNTEYGKYSPGMSCTLALVEAAASDGITRIELGKGTEEYKQSLKNFDEQVCSGWAERPVPAAYLRRAQQFPQRVALEFVLGSPVLRKAARTTLKKIGAARTKFS